MVSSLVRLPMQMIFGPWHPMWKIPLIKPRPFTPSHNPRDSTSALRNVLSIHQARASPLKIGNETSLPVEKSVKCLGVWWDTSPSSRTCVSERIQKARAAFFANGQLRAFHGLLNPLSSRSIVESCILPVLLYGSEHWVLNFSLLEALESFQAELGRRILKLPKFSSKTVPLLVLNWPSICARILCNKLSFLFRVCNGESSSLSTQVFRSSAVSDVTSMSIVKQCYLLDSILGTQCTNEVLNNPKLSLRDLKKRVLEADRLKTIEKSGNHPSLTYVLRVAKENMWIKFWDVALDHGYDGTKASTALLKLLCLTVFRDRHCRLCAYRAREYATLRL